MTCLPRQLNLSQAIAIALAINSILRTAQSRLEEASVRVRATGFFPSASIGAGFMSRLSNDQEAGATQRYFLLVKCGSLGRAGTKKYRQTAQAL
jgi:outer membrane protein TolC